MPDNKEHEKVALDTAVQEPAAAVSQCTTSNSQTADINNTVSKGAEHTSPQQNTFFPGQHGLMIKSIGHRDGQPVDAIQKLYNSLAQRFGLENPVVAMMIELAIVDYWRLGQGHLAEKSLIDSGRYVFHPKGLMPTLIRYNAAARRNLENSLEFLQEDLADTETKTVGTQEESATAFTNDPPPQSDLPLNSTQSAESNNPPAEFPAAA